MTRQTSESQKVKLQGGKVDAFAERMSVAIKRAGGATLMAEKAGVSGSVLRKWRAGHSEPSRPHLIGMARAAGVSVGWLANGEGPMEQRREAGGISSALYDYVTRTLGPDADEEEIEIIMGRVAATALKPSAHAVSEPPALPTPTPTPIETTQQALEVVEEAMGVVGYDPGSRAMTRLMGMLLDQDIKPEALPRILEILRDHESTRNGAN